MAGTSLDQIIAGKIGSDTVFPSLEIGTEDFTGYVGACDVGYSCAYMNTISWKTPTTPMPMETNPRVVFERMFGRPGIDRRARAADGAEPQHPRLGEGRRLQPRARPRRARQGAGSISTSSTCARSSSASSAPRSRRPRMITIPVAPVGIPDSWEEHATVHVRHDGAGLRGRHHARLLVHVEPRGQPARVPGPWLQRAVASRLASRQRGLQARAAREAEHLADQPVRQVPRAAASRRRTATARCSITRRSSGAAA